MKTHARIAAAFIILAGLLAWQGAAASSAPAAEAAAPAPAEQLFLDLVNAARANPLAAAAALGLDAEQVARDLPGLEGILRGGLPALSWNAALAAAARSHTREMFAANYYSALSPDGRSPADRIGQAGYGAAAVAESLGMVFFANFIKPADAARLLYEQLLREELDPARSAPRAILSPDLRELGVGLAAGPFTQGGQRWNVYLLTADFGAALDPAEAELLRLINEARANPLAAAAFAGVDVDALLAARPDLRGVLAQAMEPLSPRGALMAASRLHAEDMFARGYYGLFSPDGKGPEERIAGQGYDFSAAAEAIGISWVFAEEPTAGAAAGRLFSRILAEELSLDPGRALTILRPDLSDVGLTVMVGNLRVGRWEGRAFMAVCDLARPAGLQGR